MENELELIKRAWKRVSPETDAPAPASAAPEDTEQLAAFIREEQADAAVYEMLARRTRDRQAAAFFRAAARDERAHAAAQQTVYFLLTGDTCRVRPGTQKAPALLPALRERYREEKAGAAAYRKAADAAESAELAALWHACAADEEKHAAALRTLIGRLLR